MSLILEALRKSEAQRRLGQAPDLHTPVATTAPRGRVPRWLLPALALMLVGAGAWWLGRMAVPDPSNGTATEAVVDPVTLPIEVGEGLATARGETEPDGPLAATVPDSPAAPPASTPRPVPRPVQDPVAAAPAPATTAVEPTRPPAPAPLPAAPEPQPAPVIAQPPSQATAPASETAPESAAPATQVAADADEGFLRLADLSAATRATLPELRISMHVYSEDPSRRFAIIDGRRVGEGGLLEGQGVVEAIRRDGIVVDFDGRRVLLPRP